MPKLKISSAARVIGIPRSTLRGVISRGSVHVDPDGLVDTTELERAGYTLQPEALAIEEARLYGTSLEQVSTTAGTPQTATLHQETDLLRKQLAVLREEFDQAHAHQRRLLRQLEQLIAKNVWPRGSSTLGAVPQPQIRKPIMTLLQDYPNGLTREEIETALALPKRKNLRDTLQGMYRAGLVERLSTGVYTLAKARRMTKA